MRKFILLMLMMPAFSGNAQTPLQSRDSSRTGPQTFAIIVGISKYKYVRPLTYADKDAELFRDYLRSPGGGSVKDENIFTLLNEEAHNLNFWGKGFQWLKAKKLQKGDKLFIYLAGHGDAIDEDQFFFLGYDCNPGGDKNNYLISGAIQLFNLKKKIANETSRGVEVVFVMDACRSDELPGGSAGQNFFNTAVTEKKAGEIIMLATGAGQESLEDASIGNGHGLFTYYLVDGLVGSADSLESDQEITFREIQTYVNRHVPAIAQQRFRRRQEPFFCCNENSEKVIGRVNTNYYRQWRATHKGPGNSFEGDLNFDKPAPADTLLEQTYQRFNAAVRNNRLTGNNSAEEYFSMLQAKFPGSGHTLDARSTLAVEFAGVAQQMVDDFIGCNLLAGNRRAQYDRTAEGLEKAIRFFREDDADFANSLLGRLFLLRALGNGDISSRMTNARQALAFDKGAYAHYALAKLHDENGASDSARWHAERAAGIAPNWPCALQLLNLVKKDPSPSNNNAKPRPPRPRFGIVVAGGMSEPDMQISPDRDPVIISIDPGSRGIFEAGLLMEIPLGTNFSIRPVALVSFTNGDIVYQRRPQTGGPIFTESVSTKYTAVNVPIGFVYYFGSRATRPYLSLAPTPSFNIGGNPTADRFRKFSMLGEGSAGVQIRAAGGRLLISPELRYSRAVTDQKIEDPAAFEAVEAVRKQSFLFTVNISW
jgi:hypothetical protein